MLTNRINNNRFVFSCEENGTLISIATWAENGHSLYYGSLQELVDNGYGEATETEYLIPFSGIYELDELEREAFGLPPLYPFDLYVQSDGLITHPTFKYTYSFRTFAPNGDILQLKSIQGPIVSLGLANSIQSYLLTKEEYQLVTAIEEFNALPSEEKTANGNLIKFSEIKSLSSDSAIILDSVLSGKSVIVPEHIKLSFDYHDGILDVTPCIDGDDEGKFAKMVDGYEDARDIYPLKQSDGTKTHVILNESQKTSIDELKRKYRHVRDEETIKRLVESPAAIFDLDAVDVSELYSDRVIEIGLYHPKVYPFISPYKSQWIPVYKIEDRINGTTTIAIKDYGELSQIERKIQEADDAQQTTVNINGIDLPIEKAKEISKNAKSQLDKKEKVGNDKKAKTHNGIEVLIIKENTEEQEYSETTEPWKMPEKLSLSPDIYLNKAYSLKQHQKEGVAWLQCLLNNQLKGCVLADDMGMGKTLQVMYAIDWHSRHSESNQPYLVVAPVSLLENWQNEYTKYFDTPRLPIITVTSSPKVIEQTFIEQLSKKQIVLTSYETLRRGQLNFCAVNFAIVVLDEAQKIKTPGTMVTNAAKALKGNFKIAMTGTPVENTFVDLWCITDFAIPGLLGNAKEFARLYQNPLKNSNSDIDALGKDIRNRIDGYFMRRMKESIASELPTKTELTFKENMPETQLQCYLAALNSVEDEDNANGKMLQTIMRIRAISDHPCLDGTDISQYSEDDIINSSAKMKVTFNILDSVKEKKEKVIIFTERKEMQKILQRSIFYKYGFCPRIVNGETATKSIRPNIDTRQKAIDSFQNADGFNVIIMSPVATGMGLNVAGANHVIHYSRHWNPAKESQATDRAYRIGQTKDVFVYYPMATAESFDTFDVILDKLLNRKIHLATSSLYSSEMIEVGRQEVWDEIIGIQSQTQAKPLTIDDVDRLNDYLFEAYIGALYEKQGYEVQITPRSGDKGIDVLAFKDGTNYAIQCKHSKNNIGQECMSEVLSGAKYYETIHGKSFIPLTWTNSHYSSSAIDFARTIDIKCCDRDNLMQWMENNFVTMKDVYRLDNKR